MIAKHAEKTANCAKIPHNIFFFAIIKGIESWERGMSMPFINSRVNVMMAESKKEEVKEKLGKVISILPGKSEEWLMIEFAEFCDLSFRGDRSQPTAFIEVKVFGNIPKDCVGRLTKEISDIYEEVLQIKRDRIYVKYEETDKWGWNGDSL